jgi:hypothetical protein
MLVRTNIPLTQVVPPVQPDVPEAQEVFNYIVIQTTTSSNFQNKFS